MRALDFTPARASRNFDSQTLEENSIGIISREPHSHNQNCRVDDQNQ